MTSRPAPSHNFKPNFTKANKKFQGSDSSIDRLEKKVSMLKKPTKIVNSDLDVIKSMSILRSSNSRLKIVQ